MIRIWLFAIGGALLLLVVILVAALIGLSRRGPQVEP